MDWTAISAAITFPMDPVKAWAIAAVTFGVAVAAAVAVYHLVKRT